MTILKKLQRWCTQPPKTQLPTNISRLSTPVIASVILVEIIALLIAPIAYYAIFVPKQYIAGPDQTLPLTDEQIRAAWPNLPTAQQIVNSKTIYVAVDSSMPTYSQVRNYTWVSPVNAIPRDYPQEGFVTRLVPVEYNIWVPLDNTTYVSVGSSYLSTDNPPYDVAAFLQVEPAGFLGTGLPVTYALAAIVIILVTLTAGLGYLLHKRNLKKQLN
jgi:hypothetical protein